MRETPPGKVVEEVCAAEITHLWRGGEMLIRAGALGAGGLAAPIALDEAGSPRRPRPDSQIGEAREPAGAGFAVNPADQPVRLG